jgi:hypothetical protein
VGRHDTLFAACDPKRYESLGAPPDHANCRTALADALSDFGVTYDQIPDPVNWFMNVAIRQRGELEVREPLSEPGDQVQLTALMDIVIAVSTCPQDLVPTNGGQPTDILVRIYSEATETAATDDAAAAAATDEAAVVGGADETAVEGAAESAALANETAPAGIEDDISERGQELTAQPAADGEPVEEPANEAAKPVNG